MTIAIPHHHARHQWLPRRAAAGVLVAIVGLAVMVLSSTAGESSVPAPAMAVGVLCLVVATMVLRTARRPRR